MLKFTYAIKPKGSVTVETVDFGTIQAGTKSSRDFTVEVTTNIDHVNVKFEIININDISAVFEEFSVKVTDEHAKAEVSLISPVASFIIHRAGSYIFHGTVSFTAKPILAEAKGTALVDLSLV